MGKVIIFEPRRERIQTSHHVRPSSRGGSGKPYNLVSLDREFHRGWHALVQNMTTEEAIDFFHIVMTGGTSWTSKELDWLRRHIIEHGLFIVEEDK